MSQPTALTAVTGYDALAHAVESFVTTRRNPISDIYSREAFRLLSTHYERVLDAPDDLDARSAMQIGAFTTQGSRSKTRCSARPTRARTR